MTRAVSVNNKDGYVLVEFRYGSGPTYSRFTSYPEDVTYSGNTYTATPALEVEPITRTGSLDDRLATIKLPLVAGAFSDLASNGEPHSPISVTIIEVTSDPTAVGLTDTLVLYVGNVLRSVRNYQGRLDVVAFQCGTAKSQLKVPLGITCDNQCAWTLGDTHCTKSTTPFTITGTMNSCADRSANITGFSPAIGTGWPGSVVPDARAFSRGYLLRDGLRIPIRIWDSASPNTFVLAKQPPASWVGQVVTIIPGCDKTIETCRLRYSNEVNFGGMGYAMPSWHPVIEGP